MGRPNMRFVPIKTDDQLNLQSLHRVRERWVMRRTAVINQIRGLLLERGITLRQGRRHIDAALPGILEDASAQLSGALRVLLVQLKLELDHLQMRIDEADAMINKTAGENEACRRLVAIPGIGPVTATAIIAAIGNGAAFKKGRGFSAWVGIVPGEYTTGGKQKLLGISKRGNSYLRRLLVQGARAVLQQSAKQSSGLSAWLAQLTTRTHSNVAAVALANKLARMAWAVLAKNEPYRPPMLARQMREGHLYARGRFSLCRGVRRRSSAHRHRRFQAGHPALLLTLNSHRSLLLSDLMFWNLFFVFANAANVGPCCHSWNFGLQAALPKQR